MLLLTATTDKIQLTTSAAVAVDVHTSYVDASNANPPVIQGDTMGRTNTAISTATTTDIVPAPGASDVRNVKTINCRNKGASNVDLTVLFDQNGTDYELFKATVKPGEVLEYVEGVGWYVVPASSNNIISYSTSTVSAGFASDTYLTGSRIAFPSGGPIAGSRYRLFFDMAKTGAGTAASVLTVRVGTAGTTADTARHTLTLGAGTAAADTGFFEVEIIWRSVGASGVSVADLRLTSNLTTTGLSNAVKALTSVSGAYDTTTASLGIGASFNGGASFSGTCNLVRAEYYH